MAKPKIQLNLKTYQRKSRIDRVFLRKYLQKVWTAVGAPQSSTELTVVFLNNMQMQCYNKQYSKKDYPTDILSFPVNDTTLENRHYLGDILISMEKAAEQAREEGCSLKRELQILLLHGVLHLLGYDHETDSGQMNRLEKRLRRELVR